jgi:hypothetical protein
MISSRNITSDVHTDTIRSMILSEHEHLNNRMAWTSTFQGFLFAALGFAWGATESRSLTYVARGLGYWGISDRICGRVHGDNRDLRLSRLVGPKSIRRI